MQQIELPGTEQTDCDYLRAKIHIPRLLKEVHIGFLLPSQHSAGDTYVHVCDIIAIYLSKLSELDTVLLLGHFNVPGFSAGDIASPGTRYSKAARGY